MVLRKDRKGMLATVDAMIFLTLLSVVATGMFSYISSEEAEQPLARSVSDDFFAIRLKASDVFSTDDSQIFPVADLIAANMNSGNSDTAQVFIHDTISEMVPPMYGYVFTITYNGMTLMSSRDGFSETSSYVTSIEINGGRVLTAELVIL